MRCTCDRCVRWPESEARPTCRRWLGFEVVRDVDTLIAHGWPCSATEVELIVAAA